MIHDVSIIYMLFLVVDIPLNVFCWLGSPFQKVIIIHNTYQFQTYGYHDRPQALFFNKSDFKMAFAKPNGKHLMRAVRREPCEQCDTSSLMMEEQLIACYLLLLNMNHKLTIHIYIYIHIAMGDVLPARLLNGKRAGWVAGCLPTYCGQLPSGKLT